MASKPDRRITVKSKQPWMGVKQIKVGSDICNPNNEALQVDRIAPRSVSSTDLAMCTIAATVSTSKITTASPLRNGQAEESLSNMNNS
ncbi:hypothetical protein ACLOJK_024189, partial [Asimina triloba]